MAGAQSPQADHWRIIAEGQFSEGVRPIGETHARLGLEPQWQIGGYALAQRSSEAAKQIRNLITQSATQVESGVNLVAETGDALRRIVERVVEIDHSVAEIAASAEEQARALGEVNSAVSQMDHVTQQNAAMVEEATAAAQSLRRETDQLNGLVGRFVLETNRGSVRQRAAA